MKNGWVRRNGAVCLLFAAMLLAGMMLERRESVSGQISGETLKEVSDSEGTLQATSTSEEALQGTSTSEEVKQRVLTAEGTLQGASVSEGQEKEQQDSATDADLRPRVALTFDDGPHPTYTAQLLDGLKERGVPATFFVVGENIPGNEDLIRRMAEEGHLIGNHTYSHANLKNLSDEAACLELTRTNQLLEEITGQPAAYVRPPFGNWKDSLDCLVSMIAVKWTVDSLDWNSRNVTEILSTVLPEVSDGDIILMHDYYDTSVEAALEIVDRLQAEGYEFVTVEDLILE